MKKLFLLASLLVMATGLWAFYPDRTAPITGYLLVIGSGRPGNNSYAPEITTIQPNGQQQVQRLSNIKVGSERTTTAAAIELHRAEILQVNALSAQGWHLVSVAQSTVGVGATTETVYVLERR